MPNPILATGAAGRVGGVGRTITEQLLKQGKVLRAMVRNEDERAQASNGVRKFHATQRLLPSSNTFNKTTNS